MLRFSLALTLMATAWAGSAAAADAVVGMGTPASCTADDFDIALNTVQTSGGGTITFNCGGAHTILFSSARTISSQVVIDGGGMITLSGNNATRLFIVASGVGATFELHNITLAKGFAPSGDGGAILNGTTVNFNGGTLHLANTVFLDNRTSTEGGSGGAISSAGPITAINSRFENNRAANGGAVFLRFPSGIGAFTNTTFKDNKTLSATNGWGGAILMWDGAKLTVRGGDFVGNSARRGGAIHNQFANVEITIEHGTLIRSNTAQVGGGIFHNGGNLTVTDSTIAENNAAFGGGLAARNGVFSFTGTTLVGNQASNDGGGIHLDSSAGLAAKLSLLNSTLSGNSAQDGGAISAFAESGTMTIDLLHVTIAANSAYPVQGLGSGLYLLHTSTTPVTLKLVNTALAGNSWPTCHISNAIQPGASASYSLWSDTSCSFGTSVQNHPNTPAALGPLANNGGLTLTHAPLEGSPLIDNGICLSGVVTDQRGANRLHGLACDIGAVEAGADFDGAIFADRFESALLDSTNQHPK